MQSSVCACRYDHYVNHSIALCVFHVYRACLLPFANTWMLWSLVAKLGITVSNALWATQAALLVSCIAIRSKPLLHAPLQIVTLCFAASSASRLCTSTQGGPLVVACMGGVMLFQAALGLLVPVVLACSLQRDKCRSFMPHVQPRRALLRG